MSDDNGYATRESLFATHFQRSYADHAQEFNGEVRKFRLQNLNDREKGKFDAEALNGKGKFKRESVGTANARLIVLCVVDGGGQRLFSAADVEALQEYDAGEVESLATACRAHCGLDEEPEKNSAETGGAASPSS